MYDSMPWHSTSKPLQAATIFGSELVLSGSTRPTSGRSDRWAIPVFAPISLKSKIATPVVSLPVPIVVGTATNGFRSPGTGVPLPIGAFTYSRKSAG